MIRSSDICANALVEAALSFVRDGQSRAGLGLIDLGSVVQTVCDGFADIGEAVRKGIAANKPYLIDVNINADQNPGGAGVWELPGLGVSKVAIGGAGWVVKKLSGMGASSLERGRRQCAL